MRRIAQHAGLPAAAVLAASLLTAGPAAAEESVTMSNWGGAWSEAVIGAYNDPYTASRGVTVNMVDYNGGIAEIRAMVEAGNVTWDMVELIPGDAIRACDEGLLEEVEFPEEDYPRADFVENSIFKCGMGTVSWSTAVAYRDDKFPGAAPVTIQDFWDLEKFPGKRGLRKVSEVNLEWALIADGVAKEDVYDVLATPAGVDRAFASLDKIKDQVVWWEAGAQAPQILADGEVVMTSAYNGRIYNAWKNEKQPFAIMWQTQIMDLSYMTVVKNAPNKANAILYLMDLGTPEIQARITDFIAYGPIRYSAMEQVAEEVRPHLPTYPDNFKHVLLFDFFFWADYKDELEERFAAWLAQ